MSTAKQIVGHADRVREAFTKQAETFEDARLNTGFTEGIAWLVDSCEPQESDVVLDVAAGTGLVSRALAGLVSSVIAFDTTNAMLVKGKDAADAEGLSHVVFQHGDAEALPFVDESFSLVVSRFSLHHLEDPEVVLGEMFRVCRPSGRVVVFDLCASEDPELARRQDHVENLRDSSHLRMITESWLTAAFARLGLAVSSSERRQVRHPLDQWLAQARANDETAARIREMLLDELDGGPPTGMEPSRQGDSLHFTHTWLSIVGHK